VSTFRGLALPPHRTGGADSGGAYRCGHCKALKPDFAKSSKQIAEAVDSGAATGAGAPAHMHCSSGADLATMPRRVLCLPLTSHGPQRS
jgi:hypothetical protein